jgi:class 3 adenylate cyclase
MSDIAPSSEIIDALRAIYRAVRAGDESTMASLCSEDPAFLVLGTDMKEVLRSGREWATMNRRIWEQVGGLCPLYMGQAQAHSTGDFGWVHDFPIFRPPLPDVPTRVTALFRRERGSWRMLQLHVSIGIGNTEAFGMDVPTPFEELAASSNFAAPPAATTPSPTQSTIVFTDIEGSTSLTRRLGDERWMTILRAHNAVVRDLVRQHHGIEVKSIGDGFMLAFPSPGNAIRCSLAIHEAIGALALEDLPPIKVRVGAHAGELVQDGRDFYGATVNYAARVAASAKGGELLASTSVRASLALSDEVTFGEPRQAELKGFTGIHALFPVTRRCET